MNDKHCLLLVHTHPAGQHIVDFSLADDRAMRFLAKSVYSMSASGALYGCVMSPGRGCRIGRWVATETSVTFSYVKKLSIRKVNCTVAMQSENGHFVLPDFGKEGANEIVRCCPSGWGSA